MWKAYFPSNILANRMYLFYGWRPIATRLEAIAVKLEAIATKFIAIELEAITTRVKAIALRFKYNQIIHSGDELVASEATTIPQVFCILRC